MRVSINGQVVIVEDADKLTIHLPGAEWVVSYLGHRQDEMDLVIDRHRERLPESVSVTPEG